MNLEMMGHDIWMRYTSKTGKTHVSMHRVWNKEKFLAARAAEAKKEGGKSDAVQITQEQYNAERAPR